MSGTPAAGILIILPSAGDELTLLFKTDHEQVLDGPLAVAHLAWWACEKAGLYKWRGNWPHQMDLATIVAGATAFLEAYRGKRPKCPAGCAWISPGRPR